MVTVPESSTSLVEIFVSVKKRVVCKSKVIEFYNDFVALTMPHLNTEPFLE